MPRGVNGQKYSYGEERVMALLASLTHGGPDQWLEFPKVRAMLPNLGLRQLMGALHTLEKRKHIARADGHKVDGRRKKGQEVFRALVPFDGAKARVFTMEGASYAAKRAAEIVAGAGGDSLTTSQELISAECDAIKSMLLEKNRKYGDSALNPIRIFSKASPSDQILTRLDDKISRLRARAPDEDEDVMLDIMGYIVLWRVSQRMKQEQQQRNGRAS